MKRTKDYEQVLLSDLRDPKIARSYLEKTIKDGDKEILALALKQIGRAFDIELHSTQEINSKSQYKRLLSQLIPDNHVIVPIWPTDEMIKAGREFTGLKGNIDKVWDAMIKAAPTII